jgi:hypothetical protein
MSWDFLIERHPSAAAVRAFAQSAFVDEDDRPDFVFFKLRPALLFPHHSIEKRSASRALKCKSVTG